MNTTFSLDKSEISKAVDFAQKIVNNQSQSRKDFGTTSRVSIDSIADTAEGKLSELIFRKFAKSYGIEIEVDFEIYPDVLQIDFGQDLDSVQIDGKKKTSRSRIDIKASRTYSKWLLVEGHKFWSDAYVMVKVDLPKSTETNLDVFNVNSISGSVAGFAYYFDIIDPFTKSPWFIFSQGEKLFSPIESKLPNRKIYKSPSEFREKVS